MRRVVVVALVDTTFNGLPFKKGWYVGPDEPQPEIDGKVWGYREVTEPDTSETDLAAQRRQLVTGSSRGSAGWVKVPGRAQPRRFTPRGPDEGPEVPETPPPPVQPKARAELGDANHPWPVQEDDSEGGFAAYQQKLRELRAEIARENAALEKEAGCKT